MRNGIVSFILAGACVVCTEVSAQRFVGVGMYINYAGSEGYYFIINNNAVRFTNKYLVVGSCGFVDDGPFNGGFAFLHN